MQSLSITASHQPPGTNLIPTQFKEGGLGSFRITNYHSLGRTSNGHCRMQEIMGWLWWQGDLRTAACGGPGGEKRLERVRRAFLRWILTIPPCPCTACVEPKAISSVSKSFAAPPRRGQWGQAPHTASAPEASPRICPQLQRWMQGNIHWSTEVIKTKLDITLSTGEWLNKLWNRHKMECSAKIPKIYYWLQESGGHFLE